MKNLLAALGMVALSATGASATEPLFAPDFSTGTSDTSVTPGTAPLVYTAGSPYTENESGGETISYSAVNNTMTSGDASIDGGSAYLSSTVSDPARSQINSNFTVTLDYSADGPQNQANIDIFRLATTGGNRDLLDVTIQPFGYFGQANINLNGDLQFDGGDKTVQDGTYSSGGVNSLSGVALTFNLVTTFSQNGPGLTNATITTTGTVSDSSGVLGTFDISTTGNTVNNSFDPANNPLTADFGVVQSGNSGILDSGATVTFSRLSITAGVPEPSTWALLLGGICVLAFSARRRTSQI